MLDFVLTSPPYADDGLLQHGDIELAMSVNDAMRGIVTQSIIQRDDARVQRDRYRELNNIVVAELLRCGLRGMAAQIEQTAQFIASTSKETTDA
jgi:hypothetical protein